MTPADSLLSAAAAVSDVGGYLFALEPSGPGGAYETTWSGPGREGLLGGPSPPGAGEEEWEGRVHPDDRPVWLAAQESIRGGLAVDAEYRLIGYDGRTRWLLDRSRPRPQVNGSVAYAGLIVDVTRRRLAQEAEAEATRSLERKVAELEALTRTLPTVVWRFTPDGEVTFCSDQWLAISGQRPTDAVDEGWKDVIHSDDLAAVLAGWSEMLAAGGNYQAEYRIRRPDGEVRWIHDVAVPVVDADGVVEHYVGSGFDVTERRLLEIATTRRAQLHALAAAFSVRALDRTITGAELAAAASRAIEEALAGDGGVDVSPDNAAFVDAITHALASAQERLAVEDRLRHDALHDRLTGLANRELVLDRLAAVTSGARRAGTTFAVLFLELNNFKIHNDSLGHGHGDQILVATAHRVAELVRPGDTLARVGGDAFVLLCEDLPACQEAVRVAERIVRSFDEPLLVRELEVYVTVSIGIATPENSTPDPEALLRDAAAAMVTASERGVRIAEFTAETRLRAVHRLSVEQALRGAVDRDELVLHYQPIVALGSGSLHGFEALVRWQHPTRGFLPPSEFIPIAESTGLIVGIGRWVIREACREAAAWNAARPDDPPLLLSVNLSSLQLGDPTLVTLIATALAEWGLPASQLGLEITEGTLLSDAEHARSVLTALRSEGSRILLDDFGTGYSALAYIQRFPFDTLKLDRSLISGIGDDRRDREIVRAVAQMARALEMQVIAEGIETGQQSELVASLGCEYAQGYLYGRPLAASAALSLVMEQRRWPAPLLAPPASDAR